MCANGEMHSLERMPGNESVRAIGAWNESQPLANIIPENVSGSWSQQEIYNTNSFNAKSKYVGQRWTRQINAGSHQGKFQIIWMSLLFKPLSNRFLFFSAQNTHAPHRKHRIQVSTGSYRMVDRERELRRCVFIRITEQRTQDRKNPDNKMSPFHEPTFLSQLAKLALEPTSSRILYFWNPHVYVERYFSSWYRSSRAPVQTGSTLGSRIETKKKSKICQIATSIFPVLQRAFSIHLSKQENLMEFWCKMLIAYTQTFWFFLTWKECDG